MFERGVKNVHQHLCELVCTAPQHASRDIMASSSFAGVSSPEGPPCFC